MKFSEIANRLTGISTPLVPRSRARMKSNLVIFALESAIVLSGCGGGGSSSGGGSRGSGLSISLLAPSSVMTGIPLGQITVYGQGFTQQSQVFVDGQPVPLTLFTDSGTLEAEIDISLAAAPGTHQLSVQTGGKASNSLPFTAYAPQPGPQIMQAIPGFLVANYEADPWSIVAADINGDGLADVIMTGPPLANSGSIAILYGQANGSLFTAQYLPAPTPYALAVGDVDGNATADLVSITTDFSTNTVTVDVWLGDGHGNFQQTSSQQTFAGVYPSSAYLVDLDGDGKPDLVLAVENTSGIGGTLVWLKNTGGGSFAAPVTLASIALDNGNFSIADFNLDGRSDILYTAPGAPESLHILLNQGNAHFSDQLAAGLNGIVGFANVLDFNLDGIPDLVVQVPQGLLPLYSFRGNGDGSFTQVASTNIAPGTGFHAYQLVAGDFDHDGFPDLAGVNGETQPSHLMYLFGDGRGNFVPHEVVGPQGGLAALGDFNGDGIPDVVVPDRFTFVSLALGRRDRNFPSAFALSPATATSISAGDINGDGLPEIFVGGDPIFGIPGTVFLNQGNNSFQFAANTDPTTFTVADLTGGGRVDLLGGQGSNLVIWPNNGTLDFSSSPITISQPSFGPIAIADMDGDGHPDIVTQGQIFYGNGAYQFTPVAMAGSCGAPCVIGNFKGDGRLDIATGPSTYLNSGNRTFQQVTSNLPLIQGSQAVVADFDGDGKDDVALTLPGDPTISIWYSRGDGTFYEATEIDPGQQIGALAVGDFDGNGRPDLAVGLMLTQQVALFFNSGKGQFTRSFFASGANTNGMIVSDLNRDGKPDLVIENFMLSFRPPNVDVVFHK